MPREEPPRAHQRHLDRIVRAQESVSLRHTEARHAAASSRSWAAWAALGLAGVAAGAVAAIALNPRQSRCPDAPITRFDITAPGGSPLTLSRRALTVSPDGTRIVYAADGRLYLRSLSDLESRPIAGGRPGLSPRVLAGRQSVVFFANGALRRLPVAGGVPVLVCETVRRALRAPLELTMASCSSSRARESCVCHPTAARPRRSCL